MQNWKQFARKCAFAATLGVSLAVAGPAITGQSDQSSALAQGNGSVIHLAGNKSTQSMRIALSVPQTIRTDISFADIVVGNPELLTITPITDRSFYLVGVKAGATGIVLFDETGEQVGTIQVQVGANTADLNKTLREALPGANIKAKSANGGVILSGKAKDSVQANTARQIAKKYDPELIDSVKVTGSQQVKLEVRFIEANRLKNKELGISLQGSDGTTQFFTNAAVAGTGLLGGASPFGQIIGNLLDKGMKVDILVSALEEKGIARRLAEPNLVALSGETASFLAGGEFPIPVGQSEDTVTIEFKKFGVGLEFTPTVLDDGLINLRVAPEVSQIDNTVSFSQGGLTIPGLSVRRAETTAELRDGQSFVIAGLLQSVSRRDLRKLPWLADIPILGALFRSAKFQKNETDLVIIVTPRLVKPLTAGNPAATPLDQTAGANEAEFFANGVTEVNRAHLRQISEAKTGVLKSGHVIDFE